MKNKNILSTLLALALLFIACEEKQWVARDTELVPVYSLTGFNKNIPLQQDVYQTKPVMVQFDTEVQLKHFDMSDFSDESTDSTYAFSYTLAMDEEINNSVDTIIQTLYMRECAVNAVVDTISGGTLSYIDHFRIDTVDADNEVIGTTSMIDTVFPPVNIVVAEDEKYYVVD